MVEPEESNEDQPVLPDPLAEARQAFEVGNYQRVRELTEPVMDGTGEVADAARALHRRTEVDSLQIGVILACVAVLGILVYTYVL